MTKKLTEGIKKMKIEGEDPTEVIRGGMKNMKIKDKDPTEKIRGGVENLSITSGKKVLPSGSRKKYISRKKRNEAFKRGFISKFKEKINLMKQRREFTRGTPIYSKEEIKQKAEEAARQWNDSGDDYTSSDDEDYDSDVEMKFGKKQKKDIKGMIKKILLYGGLPTLLVVSLGVLSNKKFSKKNLKQNTKVKVSEKLKKNTKVKVSKEEKLFKKDFVKKLKEMILERKKELDALEKDARNNEIESQNRQTRRKKRITNPFEETPEYKEYKKIAGFGRTRNK